MKNQYQAKLIKVADKHGDELYRQGHQLRASSTPLEQRQARARREALTLLEREDARRDRECFGATVHEDLQAVRRRPVDAPMATYHATDPLNDLPSLGLGRLTLALLLMAASFLAGLTLGKSL